MTGLCSFPAYQTCKMARISPGGGGAAMASAACSKVNRREISGATLTVPEAIMAAARPWVKGLMNEDKNCTSRNKRSKGSMETLVWAEISWTLTAASPPILMASLAAMSTASTVSWARACLGWGAGFCEFGMVPFGSF